MIDSLDSRLEIQKQEASLSIDTYRLRNLLNRLSNIDKIEGPAESKPIGQSSIDGNNGSAEQIHAEPYRERELPPEKWVNIHKFAKEVRKNFVNVMKDARRLSGNDEKLLKEYSDRPRPYVGKMVYHIHPDIAEKMIKEYSNANLKPDEFYIKTKILDEHSEKIAAPSSWKTNFALSLELGFSGHKTRKMAYKYYSSHPDWFKGYFDRVNNLTVHYSPELIEAMKSEIAADLAAREFVQQKKEADKDKMVQK